MAIQNRVIAHDLILSGYGFWLANDPRGSGSEFIRQPKFEELGAIHHGRKSIQPTRQELRAFYQRANPRVEHTPLWFDPTLRTHIGKAISDFMSRKRYTVWACSVGSNHVHLCIRVHRDPPMPRRPKTPSHNPEHNANFFLPFAGDAINYLHQLRRAKGGFHARITPKTETPGRIKSPSSSCHTHQCLPPLRIIQQPAQQLLLLHKQPPT